MSSRKVGVAGIPLIDFRRVCSKSFCKIEIFLLLLILSGCYGKVTSDKKYVVMSSFNEVILETNFKDEAYKTAHNLTLLGRVFSSKPCYFVIESK
jgi:hypothetical protein